MSNLAMGVAIGLGSVAIGAALALLTIAIVYWLVG
jgi:hypothetical protein